MKCTDMKCTAAVQMHVWNEQNSYQDTKRFHHPRKFFLPLSPEANTVLMFFYHRLVLPARDLI